MAQKKIVNRQFSAKKKPDSIASMKNKKPEKRQMKPVQIENKFNYVEKWDTISAIITFAIPFVVVLGTSVNNSLAMIIIFSAMLPIETILNFSMVQKLGMDKWIAATISVIVGVLIVSSVSTWLQTYTDFSTAGFGIYLYAMAAYPVLYAVFYGRVVEKLGTVVMFSFKNIMYFAFLALSVSGIREFMAQGSLLGLELQVTGSNMPFFGFIALGMVLALWASFKSLLDKYQKNSYLSTRLTDVDETEIPQTEEN